MFILVLIVLTGRVESALIIFTAFAVMMAIGHFCQM